jgi:uncharacterized protein YlxW (UPF0749 family)
MKQDDADQWHAQMIDLQADVAKRAVDECNRLRRRVRELEAQIAASPATLTELQDRVTLLEQLVAARGVTAADGETFPPRDTHGSLA